MAVIIAGASVSRVCHQNKLQLAVLLGRSRQALAAWTLLPVCLLRFSGRNSIWRAFALVCSIVTHVNCSPAFTCKRRQPELSVSIKSTALVALVCLFGCHMPLNNDHWWLLSCRRLAAFGLAPGSAKTNACPA